jgi:hypothetical protein
MKLEIANKKTSRATFLSLEKTAEGVALIVSDACGSRLLFGTILTLREDGTIYRHKFVGGGFGLALDGTGQVRIAE